MFNLFATYIGEELSMKIVIDELSKIVKRLEHRIRAL